MIEQTLEEYAVITAQIKTLTEQKNGLKEIILTDFAKNNVDSADVSVGKFTITKLKTWTYTSGTVQMVEDLKAIKAGEESTGDAACEEKPSWRFTVAKL